MSWSCVYNLRVTAAHHSPSLERSMPPSSTSPRENRPPFRDILWMFGCGFILDAVLCANTQIKYRVLKFIIVTAYAEGI